MSEQQQQRWQADATQRQRSSRPATAAPGPALPGIATFLQQPHSTQQGHSSLRPLSASNDYNLHRQQQQHQYYRQSQQYDPSAATGFTSYTHLLDSSSIGYQQRTPPIRSPTNSNASGGSPSLSGFKSITINSNARASQRAFEAVGVSSKALNEYPISASTSSSSGVSGGVSARTHANYKPNVRRTSGGTHHRPLTRTSRYLREVDRRNILRRIEQGEKQANLAKEYQVSRAAISNLKQRRNRKDSSQRDGTEGDSEEKGGSESDTGSFHHHQQQQQQQSHDHEQRLQEQTQQLTPERTGTSSEPSSQGDRGDHHHGPVRRTSSFTSEMALTHQPSMTPPPSLSPLRLASSPSHEHQFLPPIESLDRVSQVSSATVEILLSRLVNQRTDPRILQITKSRIARLVLEHAMSVSPAREVAIPVSSSRSESRAQLSASSTYLGIDFVKPICGVSVLNRQERTGIESALLQEFRVMEPFCEIGSVSFASAFRSATAMAAAEDCTVQLPQTIHESNVLVLVDTLSSRSLQEVVIAIQAALRSGGQQKDICLVTICSHEHAVAYLLNLFPQLRLVTAKILLRGDPSSNGVLELLHEVFSCPS